MRITIPVNPLVIGGADNSTPLSAQKLLYYSVEDKSVDQPVFYNEKHIGSIKIDDIDFTSYTVSINLNTDIKELIDKPFTYEFGIMLNDEIKSMQLVIRPRSVTFISVDLDEVIQDGNEENMLDNISEKDLEILVNNVKFKNINLGNGKTYGVIIDIDIAIKKVLVAITNSETINPDSSSIRLFVIYDGNKVKFGSLLVEKTIKNYNHMEALSLIRNGYMVTRQKWLKDNIYLINVSQGKWNIDYPFKKKPIHGNFIAKVDTFISPWYISNEDINATDYVLLETGSIINLD